MAEVRQRPAMRTIREHFMRERRLSEQVSDRENQKVRHNRDSYCFARPKKEPVKTHKPCEYTRSRPER